MKCQCVVGLSFSYTWAVFQIELIASGLSLSTESQSNAADKRLLDILRQGLATEFPNPERIGCPGSALLKGIAQGKVSLTEAEPWLNHLGSCSPCFQEFKEFRRQSAIQRRRMLVCDAGRREPTIPRRPHPSGRIRALASNRPSHPTTVQ